MPTRKCGDCIHDNTGNCPAASAFRGKRLHRLAVRRYTQGEDISVADEVPDTVALLRDGWAVQFVPVAAHDRQILHYFIAGDILDQDVVTIANAPTLFPTEALTDVTACLFNAEEYRALLATDPRSRHFVKQRVQQYQKLSAKHLVDVARRRAPSRIASFVLELRQRLIENGLGGGDLPFPFRQKDIADALGLTIAHVNRTLKALSDLFVIRHDIHALRILHLASLASLAAQVFSDSGSGT